MNNLLLGPAALVVGPAQKKIWCQLCKKQ